MAKKKKVVKKVIKKKVVKAKAPKAAKKPKVLLTKISEKYPKNDRGHFRVNSAVKAALIKKGYTSAYMVNYFTDKYLTEKDL